MKKSVITKIILASIFLILLLYNFKIANDHKYQAEGDAWDYVHLGLSLAKTDNYGHLNASKETILQDFKHGRVNSINYSFTNFTAFRPPVWPLIISGIFLIFGYNLTYIIIFKFLLHSLGLYIFYRTLKLLKLQEVVIIAVSLLYGISPAWQLYSRVFLSEPITLFFITLWLYLLIRFIRNKSGFLPQAVVGGVLILSHPYYIFLPFSIWMLLLLKKEIRLKIFIASSLICASIVSTWIIRNLVILETNEIVLTTSSGAVLAKGWNPKVPEEHTNTQGDLANEELVLSGFEYDRNEYEGEVGKMQLYKDATVDFIKSNPDLIVPIISQKLLSAFNPFPETEKPGILETGRWLFHFFALLALLYILIFTRNKIIYSTATGIILSTVGITILTYSGFRFRMPQVGLEMLFIAFAINDMIKKRLGFLSRHLLK